MTRGDGGGRWMDGQRAGAREGDLTDPVQICAFPHTNCWIDILVKLF